MIPLKIKLIHKINDEWFYEFMVKKLRYNFGPFNSKEDTIKNAEQSAHKINKNYYIVVSQELRERKCLRCGEILLSSGNNNRICNYCNDINKKIESINDEYPI